MNYRIFPSLMSANLLNLGQEIDSIIQAGAHGLHLDIMDNHYVPNLTFGPNFCAAIRKKKPGLCIDVHLMAEPVDELIHAFAKAGASRISIHPEATKHIERSLAYIKEYNIHAGLVLNPATSIDYLTWCLHRLDFVLVMTVNPGFGGQTLIPEIITKIHAIHTDYPNLSIAVDGGVDTKNILILKKAGADTFIAGNAIFKQHDYQTVINKLKQPI